MDWDRNKVIVAALVCSMAILGVAIFIAVEYSLTVSILFFFINCSWVGFGFWFTSRAGIEDSEEDDTHLRNHRRAQYLESLRKAEAASSSPAKQVIRVNAVEEKPSIISKPSASTPKEAEEVLLEEEILPEGYRRNLVRAIVDLTKIVDSTKNKLSRFETVMSKRLHRTTNDEHRSMLNLRKIVTGLEARVSKLRQALDAYDAGVDNEEEITRLILSDLEIPFDPLNALPDEEPIPPIKPEAFASTVQVLCKRIARKPSFLQVLGVAERP